MTRVREATIQAAIARRLRREGYFVFMEYPLLGRIADVCGVHRATGDFVAVECKERDWGRAVHQARVYQGASDYVYVAMPKDAATPQLLQVLGKNQIGLITVDSTGRTRRALTPQRASHLHLGLLVRSRERLMQLSRGN